MSGVTEDGLPDNRFYKNGHKSQNLKIDWLFSISSVNHTLIDDTCPSVRDYYEISYVKLYEHKNYALKKEG